MHLEENCKMAENEFYEPRPVKFNAAQSIKNRIICIIWFGLN